MTPHEYSYSLETNLDDYADVISGPTNDAFMMEGRSNDPTDYLDLLECQATQLNGNIRWLIDRLEQTERQVEMLHEENLDLCLRAKKDPKEPDVNNSPMYKGDQKILET